VAGRRSEGLIKDDVTRRVSAPQTNSSGSTCLRCFEIKSGTVREPTSLSTPLHDMYDKHPVYPHHAGLFWAYEPYKTIYVLQRILTTLILVPCWVIYYGVMPRNRRPRPSWTIPQIVVVKFMKRIGKVVEVAGVTWGTHDPTVEPDKSKLKETRFEWASPLPEDLKTGIVDDAMVECKPVGMYVWPKDPHPIVHARKASKEKPNAAPIPASKRSYDVENGAADPPPKLVGIYLHGGGYCHYSAHEKSGTSRVPRRLVNDGLFQEIYGECHIPHHYPSTWYRLVRRHCGSSLARAASRRLRRGMYNRTRQAQSRPANKWAPVPVFGMLTQQLGVFVAHSQRPYYLRRG